MRMSFMKNILFPVLFSVLFFLSSCAGGSNDSKSDNIQDTTRGSISSATLLATKSASFLIPYSVDAYKIIYSTIDANENKILASGLLSIPRKEISEKSPFLSYQHASIFLDEHAPSNSSTQASSIMTLAGTGYIVSAPDFIGYGASADRIHPYLHAKTLASASIDMIRASYTFLNTNHIQTNSQLFITGYSEGGYASLALQKHIQEDYSDEFLITAVAAGAGPFDLSNTAQIIANKAINDEPAFISYLLKSYDSVYNLGKVDEMYQAQYVDTINTSFNGQNSQSTINRKLSDDPAKLFNTPFLTSLRALDNHALNQKIALNNIYDWKPTSPTRFYHGPNDETVPYSNAQKALTTMKANGASNVSLGDCPLNTHVKCAVPYVFDTLGFFNDYVEDL